MCQLTDFQKRVFEYIQSTPGREASLWQIAQDAFPEKWEKPEGRGALIGHIDRAGMKMSDKMMRFPAVDRYRCATFSSIIPLSVSSITEMFPNDNL